MSNCCVCIKGVLICLCLLLILSCNKNKICTIPIKLDEKMQRIILPLAFNGKPAEFLFDTGLSTTSIKEYMGTGRENPGTVKLFKFSCDTVVNMYPKGKVTLGSFTNEIPFLVDESDINILGIDVILQYYWYFDLDKKVVQISKDPIPVSDKESFAFNFYPHAVNKVIMIDFQTKPDNHFKMLFDTGAGAIDSGMLLFWNPDSIPFEAWRSKASDVFFQRPSENWTWMSDSLVVGGSAIDYALFSFDTDLQRINRFREKGYSGLITMDFVHRYKQFYIDPKAKKILFYGEKPEKKEILKDYFKYIRYIAEYGKIVPIE